MEIHRWESSDSIKCENALEEIRRVADDLDAYFYYGMHLANKIAFDAHFGAVQPGTMVFHDWPAEIRLPIHIDPGQRPKA
jgi:hypothetical protein